MFVLPDLPYAYDALAPLISSDTLHTHHDKHHKAYVDKTNALVAAAGLGGLTLEAVVRDAHRRGDKTLFNNAAQAWNHAFMWSSMRPLGGSDPTGDLDQAIQRFGGLPALKSAVVEQGVGHFGSGWVWIVTGHEGLQVLTTHDADDMLVGEGRLPLVVCDLWEHAYYLDYKNDRKSFLERWFDSLANWDFASAQLAASGGLGDGFRNAAPEQAWP